MSQSGRLQGKLILVTGASRGIGAGIAQTLAQQGARVALTYSSNRESAEKVCQNLPGAGHICISMNVSDSSSVQQAFDEVLKQFDRLDGLVNNAGITKDQLILRMKDEDFDNVIQTNLRGTYLCSKLAVKSMIKARSGSIVNVSSVVAKMASPGQTNYSASKAGIEGFTRSLAFEVASRHIRVNAVAPGFIVTEMTSVLDARQQEAIASRIPMGKLGAVQDVAAAVTYLLSDESTYVTGHVLAVNGGLYM
ncbi:MAG: 3-oxoacyl-[acyl-carrier-protein] reductase [Bdellovibrionales bacterium]